MVFSRSAMLIAAVFVPLLQSYGLSMTEVLQTQALFALTIAICEVPSGYLADLWGRKNTLVCGAALSALGYVLLVQANSFADFLLFELLLGIGMSLNSGADLALLYDTQSYLRRHHAGQSSKLCNANPIAKLCSVESLAGAAGAVLAGVLTLWSLQAVVIVQALITLVPFVCAVTLVEPPREIALSGHRENWSRIRLIIVKQPIVLITAIAIIVFGLAALYAFWLYQKYWELQGVPLACFGYLWATHCVIRGVASHYAHVVEAKLGPRNALILVAVLSILGFVAMAFTGGWLGVCCAFVLPISRGISVVVFADALNKRIEADFRATLNSLVSLGFRALFIITAPILGLLVDQQGVQVALLALAGVFLPIYAAVLFALFSALRRTAKEPAIQSEQVQAVNN